MDLEQLLKSRLPEEDVEIPGVGTVRVRGLSRYEALSMRDVDGAADTEVAMLALAMVDPPMTEDGVRAWQKASGPNEMTAVIDKVSELSGMDDDAAKEAYKSLREPGDGVRVLPSAEAVDDGGRPDGADVG